MENIQELARKHASDVLYSMAGASSINAEQIIESAFVAGYSKGFKDGNTANWKMQSGKMPFSEALEALKDGYRVARTGWNGKDMFIYWVEGTQITITEETAYVYFQDAGTEVVFQDQVMMKTAAGTHVPWLCSQTDLLAEDWCILEDWCSKDNLEL